MYQATLTGNEGIPSGGGVITNIFVPVQGADYTNRIGRKVRVRSVFMRALVMLDLSQQDASNLAMNNGNFFARAQHCRIMLVYDTQPNGEWIA